jgi:hypothetical protein
MNWTFDIEVALGAIDFEIAVASQSINFEVEVSKLIAPSTIDLAYGGSSFVE